MHRLQEYYEKSVFFETKKPTYIEWLENYMIDSKESSRRNFVASSVEMAEECVGVAISHEEMDKLVALEMVDEWHEYDYTSISSSMDMCVRERVLDIISSNLLGREWPTYGNPDPTFYQDFIVESRKKGWEK